MSHRVGVVVQGSAAGQCARLILPDGDIELVESDLTDPDIAARFGLDEVRHAEPADWCRGICRDGPVAGKTVYAMNRIGSKVRIPLPPRLGNGSAEYEVTRIGTDGDLAELRTSHA